MKNRGFQLLEVLLVCSLIVSAAAGTTVLVKDIFERQTLESGSQDFLAFLVAARTLSIAKNVPVQILIGGGGRRYSMSVAGSEPALWRDLPRGLSFRSSPRRPVVFHSRGTAAPAGSFVVGSAVGDVKIVVAVSGRVRWQRL